MVTIRIKQATTRMTATVGGTRCFCSHASGEVQRIAINIESRNGIKISVEVFIPAIMITRLAIPRRLLNPRENSFLVVGIIVPFYMQLGSVKWL